MTAACSKAKPGKPLEQLGIDWTRTEGIDAGMVLGVFECQSAGEA